MAIYVLICCQSHCYSICWFIETHGTLYGRQNIVFVYATRIILCMVLHNVSGIAVNKLLVGYL